MIMTKYDLIRYQQEGKPNHRIVTFVCGCTDAIWDGGPNHSNYENEEVCLDCQYEEYLSSDAYSRSDRLACQND